MSDWISVKERLPKFHESLSWASEVVLVAHRLRSKPNRLIVSPAILVQEKQGFSDGCIWYRVGGNIPIMNVTHWMPLPEPPQEDMP